MKISILGLGYVGFPVLLGLSSKTNYDVLGFDISKKTIDKISNGICPIDDKEVVADFKRNPEVKVTLQEDDLEGSDVFLICVPTPIDSDYEPDYTPLISASKMVAKHLKKGGIVVVESTINPGTCEEIVAPAIDEISGLSCGEDYDIVHAPERINPGDNKWTVYNISRNIGGSRKEAAQKIKEIYSEFISAEILVVSSLKVAESSKIVENSFRDLNIAFVNELAKSFDAMEIDLIETIHAANNKPFGYMAFWPGPGVGGHCIAVDPYYLIKRAAKAGFNHRLLKEGRNINNSMPLYVVEKTAHLLNEIEKSVKGAEIALLGMSYKANVGDLRESPALEIREILEHRGANLRIFDPHVPEISTHNTLEETLKTADTVILLANHDAFKDIDGAMLKKYDVKIVIDTRAFFEKDDIEGNGLLFTGVGR